ncbi:DUF5667 domain-containing protein [Nocardioides sp. MH1]|uniref:DUF5667 domain-containing protein n=1 Tax=Nocardioides sp. MH1 TaxID=3242490 RepID=UPI0035225E29
MTRAYVSRRRAEEFDALLSSAPKHSSLDPAVAELLEVVGALRSAAPVEARAEFVSDLRSRLVVEAARQARPVDDALRLRLTPKQRSGARERRAATLLGGFAIVAATGSMAMASQAALPGDVLYPVKRAIENAHTNLQSDDAAKAETLLSHAQTRLDEAKQLTAEGADASTVASTLQDFTDQSSQATELVLDDYAATGDESGIGDLRSFASESMGELDQLGDVVPSDARSALITAAQSVMQADSAALQVCPTCGDDAVTELPNFAATSSALVSPLLTYGRTPQSVTGIDPHFLNHVQQQADQTPVKGKPGKHVDQQPPAVDPTDQVPDVSDDLPDTSDDVPDSLSDLGDKIKHGLTPGNDDTEIVTDTLGDVVSGVGQLVDGLLGQ